MVSCFKYVVLVVTDTVDLRRALIFGHGQRLPFATEFNCCLHYPKYLSSTKIYIYIYCIEMIKMTTRVEFRVTVRPCSDNLNKNLDIVMKRRTHVTWHPSRGGIADR